MSKNKVIFTAMFSLLLLTGCGAKPESVASMQEQNVSIDEVFNQAKLDSKGQAYINMIDNQLLEPRYGYDHNATVKDTVDKRINDINTLQPGLISQYQAKDAFDLLKKTGSLLSIMKEQYGKDEYIKNEVNDASLKKLYDAREGETVNYSQIILRLQDFDNDRTKLSNALVDVTKTIKSSKDIKQTFKELAAKYPGTNNNNGDQGQVSRGSIDAKILKPLDTFKENGHNKDAIIVGPDYYFVLRNDDGSRLSFAASKEKLTDLQYEKAKNANENLDEYYLMLLRNRSNIKFVNAADQAVYNEAQRIVNKAYLDAKKGSK